MHGWTTRRGLVPFLAVCALMVMGAAPGSAGIAEYQSAVNAEGSLISYYMFDAGTASDAKGGHDGALVGTAGFGLGVGGLGQTLSLDGAGHVNIGTAGGAFDFADGSGAIEAWVRPTWATNPGYNPTVMASREGGPVRYSLHLWQNMTGAAMWTGALGSFPSAIPRNEWTHLAMVFEGGTTRGYINGAPAGQASVPLGSPGHTFQIGSAHNTPGGQERWIGDIDEVAIYEAPLTSSDIQNHYLAFVGVVPPSSQMVGFQNAVRAEPSLISYYTFDGDTTAATDTEGSNHGTLVGAVPWGQGVDGTGQALDLIGGGHVNLGTVPDFDFADGTGTIEAWVRPDWAANPGYNPCVMASRNGGPTRYSMHLEQDLDAMDIWTGQFGAFPESLSRDEWHHVAMIFDGGTTRGYIDGRFAGQVSVALGASGQPFQIGSSSPASGGQERWLGGLDEVAIYSDALTINALQAHYKALMGSVAPSPRMVSYQSAVRAESSLISYYTFDDDVASVADTVGANNGALVGVAPWGGGVEGGQALDLSGQGHVNVGAVPDFDFADGTGTIEAWVRPTWRANPGYNPAVLASRDGGPVRYSLHAEQDLDAVDAWTGTFGAFGVPLARDGWSHVAMVFEGGQTRAYVNGRFAGVANVPLGAAGQPFQIGSSSPGAAGQERWIGGLDEVAVYRDALSTSDVLSHMRAFQGTAAPTGRMLGYQRAVNAEPSLISYYTFDGDTSAVADTKGANHGTLMGAATFSAGLDGSGQALELDGRGHVDLGAVGAFDFPDGSGTVEGWIRAPWRMDPGYDPCIFAGRDNSNAVRYSIHERRARNQFAIWTGVGIANFSQAISNDWHHVAYVLDSGTATVYYDGQSLGTLGLNLGSSGHPFQIGASRPNNAEAWLGSLDEIAVYSDPLSADVIRRHYEAALSKPGSDNFDDGVLAPRWVKDEPDPARAFGQETGGVYRMTLINPGSDGSSHDMWGGRDTSPVLLTEPPGDGWSFDANVEVTISYPGASHVCNNIADLFVHDDNLGTGILAIGLNHLVGGGVDIRTELMGAGGIVPNIPLDPGVDHAWLRVTKQGDFWSFFYKLGLEDPWIHTGSISMALADYRIGLVGKTWSGHAGTVFHDFDNFTIPEPSTLVLLGLGLLPVLRRRRARTR